MDFQIRLSDTGHSQKITFEPTDKGEKLIKHIGNAYMIDAKDQLLLTKIGHIIKPEQLLGKVLTDVRGDKTLVSKVYKQGAKASTESVHCIYVFNLKELKKSQKKAENGQQIQKWQRKQKGEKKQNNYWLDKMNQKLNSIHNLRPAIIAYDPLSDLFSAELMQNHSNIVDRINSLRNSLIKLDSSYIELKEIHAEVEDIIQRCANQKKSLNPLNSSMLDSLKLLQYRAQKVIMLKEKLKQITCVDDKSLRENSGCFQNKKRQDLSVSFYEEKIASFKEKVDTYFKNTKQSIKKCKEKFRGFDLKSVDFGKLKIDEQINKEFRSFKEDYNKILECFKQFEGSRQFNSISNLQNLIKLLEKSLKQNVPILFEQFYKLLTDYYIEFSQINEQNRFIMKEVFQVFENSKNIINQYKIQISSEQKNLNNDLKKYEASSIREPSFTEKNSQVQQKSFISAGSQKSLQSFKVSIKMEAQIKRRLIFYKKINYLQSLGQKMCMEEELLRKKYANQHKSSREGTRELLKNIKVPTIDIDYEGTTDIDLFKKHKIASNIEFQTELKPEQFMVVQYKKIIEQINSMIGQDSNTKIKNLQIILTKMSDIFMKVYNDKIEVIKAQKQTLSAKNAELQAQIIKLEQNTLKNNEAKEEMKRLITEKQKLFNDLQKNRLDDIGKERSRTEKAISEKKLLESDLKKQMRLSEQLQSHFIFLDKENELKRQECDQLKMLLGDKQIQIIKLQEQISDLKMHNKLVQTPIMNQSQLKSVVLQNFSKNQKDSNNSAEQIQKLNQQISILQSQNDQLKVQNEQLIYDLNQIIRRQTYDVQIQADDFPILQKESALQGITIGQQIKLGQTAIFMPFSNNVYVGVYHKDQDRTLCNISNLHQANFLLDLSSFSIKTRQLLSQCSFLTIIKVNEVCKDGNNYEVRGKIEHLLGFEDDNLAVKDYAALLYN